MVTFGSKSTTLILTAKRCSANIKYIEQIPPLWVSVRWWDDGPDFCSSGTEMENKPSGERACTAAVFFSLTLQLFQEFVF